MTYSRFECSFGLANWLILRCGNISLARRCDVCRQKNKYCDRERCGKSQSERDGIHKHKLNCTNMREKKIELNHSKVCSFFLYLPFHRATITSSRRVCLDVTSATHIAQSAPSYRLKLVVFFFFFFFIAAYILLLQKQIFSVSLIE